MSTAVTKKVPFSLTFALTALGSAYFFMLVRLSLSHESTDVTLRALTDGTAPQYFQHRALVFWMAKFLILLKVLSPESLYVFFMLTETLSGLLLVFAFRWYLLPFIGKPMTSSLFSLSILYILPFHYIFPRILPIYFPYDLPAILFFTVGLGLMQRRNWLLYYPLFLVAVLNRETAGFLTFIYLLTSWRSDKPAKVLGHCTAQAALWLAAKGVLYELYQSNPGQNFVQRYHEGTNVTHLSTNVDFLLHLSNYPLLLSMFGFAWIPVIVYRSHIRDPFVRRSLAVLLPFFAMTMYAGNIYEMRLYGELIPVVLAAALVVIQALSRGSGQG
jgi:hypothetical protein